MEKSTQIILGISVAAIVIGYMVFGNKKGSTTTINDFSNASGCRCGRNEIGQCLSCRNKLVRDSMR